MLTVTREGQVLGNYWAGLRRAEQQRAAESVALVEQRETEQIKTALKTMGKWQETQTKAAAKQTPKPKPEKPVKPTHYNIWGDEIEQMYKDNWKTRDIAAYCNISVTSVKLILARKAREPVNKEKWLCPECGYQNEPKDRYCWACGGGRR